MITIQRAHFDTEAIRFQPAEVETITGVPPVLLRDWRRRGILSERNDGKVDGFSVGALAEIALFQSLSTHGIGPKAVHGWSFSMVGHIVQFALAEPEAWATAEAYSAWRQETINGKTPRYAVLTSVGVRSTDSPMALPMGSDENVLTIVDLKRIGDMIRVRAGKPLAVVSGYHRIDLVD